MCLIVEYRFYLNQKKSPMKYALILLFCCTSFTIFAQDKKNNLPEVKLKTIEGKTISSSGFYNGGKPMVISFWATWCKPCVKELMAIHEQYEKWQEETGVKLIAISIDDSRNASKVGPFINSKGWEFDVYLDENSDFRRAMNVANVPHTFLIDGKGNIVWQHNNYLPGDENELLNQIKALVAGSK